MAQHFLLSRAAKTLSLATVFTMKDDEAEMTFRRIRWADTDGEPVCPHCGGLDAYDCRRLKGAPRFRCRACEKDFTITSGTLFASHKLPLRCYLAAIAIFCNEVKGKSALALSRDLGVSYKCAFVLLHKLREAMAEEMKGRVVGGEGKVAEVDGGYFGGYVKPANHRENRRDRRLCRNQNGKRKVVVIVRERGGNSRPGRVQERSAGDRVSSAAASPRAPSSTPTKPVMGRPARALRNEAHQPSRGLQPRRCLHELGGGVFLPPAPRRDRHHHHIAGPYLLRYAQEASWREDNRRVSNGDQVNRVAALALKRGKSVDFTGYWQRHIAT